MTDAGPHSTLRGIAAERGESLAALSAMIGRNAAYLHQFVTRGSPRRLAEHDRRLLADYLGVSERALGAPAEPRAIQIRRLDLAASAGPGTAADDDIVLAMEQLDPALARGLRLDPDHAHILTVRGNSMEPSLMEGDQIYVDTRDRTSPRGGAIFVIRLDELLMVKRVTRAGGDLLITSDNPQAAPITEGRCDIIGRVVWQTRRLR